MPSGSDIKVYRFSNDILFVSMAGASREEAHQFAQAILTKFRSPWYFDENEHHLEVYAGVTVYPKDADDVEDCVKAVTHTLRLAKERKLRDAAFYSEGLEEKLNDNLQINKLIMDAAENDFKGFYYLYQPVLEMKTGELQCCEASLFWGNEETIVPREKFLPIIDKMGLSTQLYRFALDKLCEFCAEVRESGADNFRVGFNIPENILYTDMCIEGLRSTLLEYSLPPEALSVSVSVSARTLTTTNVYLKQLSKMGVNIIADDNGDNFFTAEPLDNNAIKAIKIKSSRFNDDPISSSFLKSVIKMAKERNIAVCARGVDNAKMFEQVRKFDVDLVEGIFNGRPLHSAEFVEKLLPKERVRRY
jgi:EAL domain-containing protein (putative c-di-GMP-specific phosphodiesterase class I)